jgi:hypothetical protein
MLCKNFPAVLALTLYTLSIDILHKRRGGHLGVEIRRGKSLFRPCRRARRFGDGETRSCFRGDESDVSFEADEPFGVVGGHLVPGVVVVVDDPARLVHWALQY